MVNKVWKAQLKLWMSHGEKFTEPEIILGPNLKTEPVKNATITGYFGFAFEINTGREIISRYFCSNEKNKKAGFFKFLRLLTYKAPYS